MADLKYKYVYGGTQIPLVEITTRFYLPGDLVLFVMEHGRMSQRAAANAIYNAMVHRTGAAFTQSGVGITEDGEVYIADIAGSYGDESDLEAETVAQFRRDGEVVDLGQDAYTPQFADR